MRTQVQIAGPGARLTEARYAAKLALHPGDCGIDLFPRLVDEKEIQTVSLGFYQIWSVPTGVHVMIPEGYFAYVCARSSTYEKLHGCSVIPGVIDHGYTGEYRIRIQVPTPAMGGYGGAAVMMKMTEAILDCAGRNIALAQFMLIPFAQAGFELVAGLSDSARGDNGYGSTDPRTND